MGGVYNSDHLKDLAADITTASRAWNEELYDIVTDRRLPFKQFITYGYYEWFHISIELPKWEVIFKRSKS